MCRPPLCVYVCSSIRIYIYPRVWVCVSAKCHINRLIAAVSDSVTLWLVDSSLIHTPSWVIGPAHWFPACQPSQEELRGRMRACRYWLAPDQPHHHLPITHTHTRAHTPNPTVVVWHAAQFPSTFLWLSSCYLSALSLCPSVPLGVVLWCHLRQSMFFYSEIFLLTDFYELVEGIQQNCFNPSRAALHGCQYFHMFSYLYQSFKAILLAKSSEHQKPSVWGLEMCL